MATVLHMSQSTDINPRPHKRPRMLAENTPLSTPSTLTAISTPSSDSESPARNIPPPVLLSSIPGLVSHPPNHRYYILSLQVSLNALRKCLAFPALSPEIECRAWTGLAEVGMKVIASGFCESNEYEWTKGLEIEVDKALSKGATVAQKHPSLRPYKLHIALLQAQYSQWQHKTKYARTQIRNLISSFQPTDPPYLLYSAQLASISLSTTSHAIPPSKTNKGKVGPNLLLSPKPSSRQDLYAALSTIEAMETHALKLKHPQIALLSYILRLRVLVSANMWSDVPEAIQLVESALGLSYEPTSTPKTRKPAASGTQPEAESTFIMFEDPFEGAMAIHLLMMSVAYFTHLGSASEASPRLTHLHALLDSGVLDLFPDGLVQIQLPSSPPLIIQITHPRILFLLAFLVSSTAKRDVVGRKPKRKVFANEGLAAFDKKNVPPPLILPLWASTGDVEEIEERLARIKADLMCEVISVSIMRSEFTEAEETLAELIAHTRTYSIFPHFAARISLHHAHLAHALGNSPRATDCYIAASQLSQEGDFVYLAARVGLVCLNLVEYAEQVSEKGDRKGKKKAAVHVDDEVVELKELLKECRAWGGTLDAVAHVLEACFSSEILKAKQHLKAALTLASNSQDNHLRASILALIASQYFYTARDHCMSTLQTCEQLAAGLGAPLNKGETNNGVPGNVHLALWVGKHFLDLHKQAGREAEAQQRVASNDRLEQALETLRERGQGIKSEG